MSNADKDTETLAPRVDGRSAGKLASAMLVIAAGVGTTYAVPQLAFAQPWTPEDPVPFWNLLGRYAPTDDGESFEAKQDKLDAIDDYADEALAKAQAFDDAPPAPVRPETVELPRQAQTPAFKPQPGDEEPAPHSLELFKGDELDPFFARLAKSEAGIEGAVTRVIHWGDSAIGVDGIPGEIRKRMQARFGNSGHGFHLMEPPNTSYRHKEVEFRTNEGWKRCFIINKCADDGRYGLGGVVFRSFAGAESWFAPDKKYGAGEVSRFVLHYLAQPEGGDLRLKVDGGESQTLNTAAAVAEERFHEIKVPRGMHELSVRATGNGQVKAFGVTMERDVPGVVWDGLALVGAFTKRLEEYDETHLEKTLDAREVDLVVLTFGGNDMVRKISSKTYEAEYRTVIQKIKKARPEAACLIMSPLDHAKSDGVTIESLPIVPRLVAAQRRVAQSEGCAFFSTYDAMGGKGSAARWNKRKPRLISGDLGHATPAGHKVVGDMVYRAILEAYVAYRKKTDAAAD